MQEFSDKKYAIHCLVFQNSNLQAFVFNFVILSKGNQLKDLHRLPKATWCKKCTENLHINHLQLALNDLEAGTVERESYISFVNYFACMIVICNIINNGSQSYMRNSSRLRCNAFTRSKIHNIDARPCVILP